MGEDQVAKPASKAWHSYSTSAVFRELTTSEQGLSQTDAEARLLKYGQNAIAEMEKDPWYLKLLSEFKSLPIVMLLAAAAISLFLGLTYDKTKLVDAGAIVVAVLIAVFFSFWQEYRAEKALEALKRMVVQRSVALRGGREMELESAHLVPGDIVLLEEGNRVPADVRIIESVNLAAEQSALTGESAPSHKDANALDAKTALSERTNMLYAGTTIVRGHCRGVVVETAMSTEFGKIVGYVAGEKEEETPLQKTIGGISRDLGYAGIIAAILFFIVGIARGEPAVSMFVVGVTLAVAVIPEGLPTVLAITLALGVQKMAKKNAIVRKMSAVETLGSATVICTDKTGTITQNRMVVKEIILAESTYGFGPEGLDSSAAKRDPALYVRKMRNAHALIGEVPFASERKMMSAIRMEGKQRVAFVKGAPERLAALSKKVFMHGSEKPMSAEWRKRTLDYARELGKNGYRVLGLAYRPMKDLKNYTTQNTEHELVFVGMVAMEDPPRPEAAEAIMLCRSAGIKVVMVTGDSPTTARAIAMKVGLLSGDEKVVDGSVLADMSDAELDKLVPGVAVFARVTPEEKYRIVSAYLRRGEVVAVTGDGVNDAPAIKKANIGVAMGISGTDVTKEVADIVLTDDNFSSIVNAVKYGRTIFNNIKSFIRYQVSTNVAALTLMFAAPVLGLPLPLIPVQLLWINIMVDGPPALALGAEPPSQNEMKYKPRDPKAQFFNLNLIMAILVIGLIMGFVALSVFGYYLEVAPEKALTVVFTTFVFLQLFNALNCRSAGESIFARFLSNPYLFAAIAGSLLLHLAIVYYAPLQAVFRTVPLDAGDFAIIIVASLFIIVFEEFKKRFFKHITIY
ncbi:MAG: cation-translocating P-type ATPase [Candidatus Micrarchaeota archaeon]|nr:cation-translocating P-type ATPase [Candidatus Micrarchaeota archaeon]